MGTAISDIAATVQQGEDSTVQPWIQWTAGEIDIGVVDDSDAPFDLTGYSITCTYRHFTGSVEEEGDGTDEEPLTAAISDRETVADLADGTLTVTIDSDATTGLFSLYIPADIYVGAIAPDISALVPIVTFYLRFVPSGATPDTFSQRHSIYIRDGGPRPVGV